MKRNIEAIVYFVCVDASHHIFSDSYGRVRMRLSCDKLTLERTLSQLVNAIILKLDAINCCDSPCHICILKIRISDRIFR